MPREYRHIQEYEKEILELRVQGKTRRETCEKFGFSMKQMENFITRYNRRQDKIAEGVVLKRKISYDISSAGYYLSRTDFADIKNKKECGGNMSKTIFEELGGRYEQQGDY